MCSLIPQIWGGLETHPSSRKEPSEAAPRERTARRGQGEGPRLSVLLLLICTKATPEGFLEEVMCQRGSCLTSPRASVCL